MQSWVIIMGLLTLTLTVDLQFAQYIPLWMAFFVELLQYSRVCNYRRFIYHRWFPVGDVTVFRMTVKNESVWRDNRNYSAILATLQITSYVLTRIILRPLSALSLDEVNIAKRNITTGLFGLRTYIVEILFKLFARS